MPIYQSYLKFVSFFPLQYMKQIRVYEVERDSGKWNKLSSEQFRDKESELQGLVVGGRSRNVMANHTLYTLELLTEEIKDIFCHHVMVDRLADMLNYFLEHLVTNTLFWKIYIHVHSSLVLDLY